MGYNARNGGIRDNVTRMRRAREAEKDALAIVRRFDARPFQPNELHGPGQRLLLRSLQNING